MVAVTPPAPLEASALDAPLRAALDRRAALLARLAAEGTDCVRLLHGAVEGVPGLTVDRYGPVLLLQTGRARLAPGVPEAAAEVVGEAIGEALTPVWNHRPAFRRGGFGRLHAAPRTLADAVGREEGLSFVVDPRAGGLDPLLFLDLRAGRRAVRDLAAGASVLNLFAYTCGIGVAAAAGGAREVVNVDFARSALTVGARNAGLNGVAGPWFRWVHEDFFPVARQLAGLPVKGRGARRPYLRVAPRTFDVTVLDPPRWAKTPFGAVDVIRDYPSLFKPALLATRPGGWVLATHHVPSVSREDFLAVLHRTAEKVDRRLEDVEVLPPEPDFPSPDGRPPLKLVRVRVALRR
ncbi:MAG TPA: class I SAM-dependent methyltransferase [Sandaracinaceae bacterium LLY-WYZ-13_1]|nr:class I SAM-dependent methyltransferase [Sandaracinaceae bacterium LLY-WYZ-13_1]